MEKAGEVPEWQEDRGWGNSNGEKGYKKVIIIFLFTHTTPGTPASDLLRVIIL